MSAPFQAIPDSTQVHVDRLVGAQLGDLEVGARLSEGRFGTIYAATRRASGKAVTLEVLRTQLSGDDEEVKATKAIKCAGVAEVYDFGQLPDGRRYRVMDLLAGESLDQRRPRPPAEVAKLLGQVAEVLETMHSWALPHGTLGPSSVFLVNGAVKLIDFGLAKGRASLEGDLQALGALGFTLLTGEELGDRAPPPLKDPSAEPLDRFLRELMEKRVKNATAARKELALLLRETPAAPPRRSRALPLMVLAIVLAAIATAALFWVRAPEPEVPLTAEDEEALLLEDAPEDEPVQPDVLNPDQTAAPRPPSTTGPRRARPVPSARVLMEEISRLESRLRKQAKPGDDLDPALFVLNKQRLRLSGAPTELDRKDVAKQLAGWRRSYLRR